MMTEIRPNSDDSASADNLVDPAIELVKKWLDRAEDLETSEDRATMQQLNDLVLDDKGVEFVMQFVDRVARPTGPKVAADQLATIVANSGLPNFLSPVDKGLLKAGARLAPILPKVVMPLAKRRMRAIVGHLVAPAEAGKLAAHLGSQRNEGYRLNVNLLGEAVLGEREAAARLKQLVALLSVPGVDYVSVKLTAVASQLNHWAYDASLRRVTERIETLLDAAESNPSGCFVNFDMEEHRDLHLTLDAFKAVLGDVSRQNMDAGIVLQAYLPDVHEILQDLVAWSNERHKMGGGTVKIRLVKGANLAMEQVEAALHSWEQAPYGSKIETDASYRRCLDWVLTQERLAGVRIGVASHNLFDVAWTKLLADKRGVTDRIQFEMLQGMAPGQAKAVNTDTPGSSMLLYTPAVKEADFDVAIGYLFRRLEENAAPDNFMRALFELKPGSDVFTTQADLFRDGVALRHTVTTEPRRKQDRNINLLAEDNSQTFENEPDTDPSAVANRSWIDHIVSSEPVASNVPELGSISEVNTAVELARGAAKAWAARPAQERRAILYRVAAELSKSRGSLIAAMMHEASKTISEADVEVSEAIDFARWYADRSVDLENVTGAKFTPFPVVGVFPPWNFPTAIPTGGMLASLAAGCAVICKPAPATPRCSQLVVQACWAAGVPEDVLQIVAVAENELGRHLVESVDLMILTGSSETADLFKSWKPDLRLLAETSGKNVMIITPNADLDQAVDDLVRSAFGHAGQKCSAASLAVLVGDVASSDRFRRQLKDAVESLTVGPSRSLDTDVAPLVGGGNERLDRAIDALDHGESWFVKPVRQSDGCVSPGVREGVRSGSWFHETECFGPVLGLMEAETLEDAISIANSSEFGLTGGIQSLDPSELAQWQDQIEVGNGYINRSITGAIVQRQPFGGWKRSSVGLGAKAGGPNYLMQLGTWAPMDTPDDYAQQWTDHFSQDHDESNLFCEANIFRYRPLNSVVIRTGPATDKDELALAKRAAEMVGAKVVLSNETTETGTGWLRRAADRGTERVRLVGGSVSDDMRRFAASRGIHLIEGPVTPAGRIELQHFVREQAISITLHRFGNLVSNRQRSSSRSA